jgi:hypothetical protein
MLANSELTARIVLADAEHQDQRAQQGHPVSALRRNQLAANVEI